MIRNDGMNTATCDFDGLKGFFPEEFHTYPHEGIGNKGAHIGIERVHDLAGLLNQRDIEAPYDQRFGHFEPNIPSPDHDGFFRTLPVYDIPHPNTALEGMKSVYAPGIGSGHPGAKRNRPCGDQQVIKGLPSLPLFPNIVDAETTFFQINLGDFMEDTGINTIFVSKFLRCDGHQFPDIVDNLADVVRNTSGRVGCVGSLLEHKDVQLRLNPLCLGGRAHSCRISTDDHKPFLLQFSCTSSTTLDCHSAFLVSH